MTDTAADPESSFDDIDAAISGDQSNLLATMHDADGMPTGRLREATAIPSGSMHYHLSRLENWGLIEVVGRQPEGAGSPSKVWATTERGRTFLERPGVTGPRTIQELSTHIEDLERTLTHRDERIETLETDVEALEDEIEDVKAAYNTLASAVEAHFEDHHD